MDTSGLASFVDTIPRVAATAMRTRGGGWDLKVTRCPYCSTERRARSHVHGGGGGPAPEDGVHRVPHCVRPQSHPGRGYVLTLASGAAQDFAQEPGAQARRAGRAE